MRKELRFLLHSKLETSSVAFIDVWDDLRVCERRKSDFWFVLSAIFAIVVAENILKLYQVHVGAP